MILPFNGTFESRIVATDLNQTFSILPHSAKSFLSYFACKSSGILPTKHVRIFLSFS